MHNSFCFMRFIYDWCEERFEFQLLADDILAKFIPVHINIFYCFGGIVLTAFLFQVMSGFALTIHYRSTIVEAYLSVQVILLKANFGWLIRSIHRWSSSIMSLFIILHVARVYFTGGFKKPREFTCISGLLLAIVTLVFGVSGYSLPWDIIAYWA